AAWVDYGLGRLLGQKGDYAGAEPSVRRAVSVFREELPGTGSLAMALNGLGNVLGFLGQDREALDALRESARIMEEIWGPGHPLVAQATHNLGVFHLDRGRYSEAEPYLRSSLAMYKDAYGERQSRSAAGYTNLGVALQGQGRLDEAEAVFRKALALHQELAVGDSWTVGHLIASAKLGACLHYRGSLAEAETVLRETESRFRTFAPDHPQCVNTLMGLGSLLVDRGKYAEADEALRRCLDSMERRAKQFARQLPHCRNALAACCADRGRTAEADSLFRASMPQAWTTVGRDAGRLARARARRFYEAQDRADMVARIEAP
ncbi:MAG: tetratricopeptide repeat protein, partial [Candidatus Eisenbacteria bacterium]|nr:tetratricopeptide repeat protein [Candidatus Eisenbacteria bacterium]